MTNIPNCFYRLSIKALVLNETKDKFLILQEDDGRWELPGGGLDWGQNPQEDLAREIQEEMGIKVARVAAEPSYFFTFKNDNDIWVANLLFETTLPHLNFVSSKECRAVTFINKESIEAYELFPSVARFTEQFDPCKH